MEAVGKRHLFERNLPLSGGVWGCPYVYTRVTFTLSHDLLIVYENNLVSHISPLKMKENTIENIRIQPIKKN